MLDDMVGGVLSQDGHSTIAMKDMDFKHYVIDRAWRISHIDYQIGLIAVTSACVQLSVYNSPGSGNTSDRPTASTGPMVVSVPGKRARFGAKPTGWFPAGPPESQKLVSIQHIKQGEGTSTAAVRHVIKISIEASPEIWDLKDSMKLSLPQGQAATPQQQVTSTELPVEELGEKLEALTVRSKSSRSTSSSDDVVFV